MEGSIDVVELCALLQCLGFTVKSLNSSDANISQDGGSGGGALKTVVINCQSSGLHVVLESPAALCSCPPTDHQNSGFWQVSGVTGGKQLNKESGSSILCTLPKTHRERISRELCEVVKNIKEHGEEAGGKDIGNRSTSMLELKTPEKSLSQIKMDTPTRYRSLDTLTTGREGQVLPLPGSLQKKTNVSSEDVKLEQGEDPKIVRCRRQSTYTISSTPGSVNRIRNKTSSPIQQPNTLVEGLLAAEKTAEDLRNILSNIIKEFVDDGNESSMSSLALDVSKISVMKGIDPRLQFASSPNLSGLTTVNDDFKNNRLRRLESASTSNLASRKLTPNKESKTSRLRRISPNIFGLKKDKELASKPDKLKTQDKSGKFNCLFKPKIVTPVRVPKPATDTTSSLSASKRKFSHVKSTIPRPTPRKE